MPSPDPQNPGSDHFGKRVIADAVSGVASTGAQCVQVRHVGPYRGAGRAENGHTRGGGQSHRGAPDDDKAGIQGTRLQDEKSQDRQQGADVGRGPGEDSHPGGTGPAGPRSQRPGSRRLLSWAVTPVGRRATAAGGWSRPCPLRDPTALPDESLSPTQPSHAARSPWCRLPGDLAAHPPGVSGDPARPEMQSPLPAAAPSRAPAPSVHTSLLRPGFK